MTNHSFTIRRAEPRDIPVISRFGVMLLRTHFVFDQQRFMAPRPDAEDGYAWFEAQMGRHDAVVFVAERDGAPVGYLYAAVEPLSWKELRDEAGFIHDIYVDEGSRGLGVATALLEAGSQWLTDQGVPRVILWTAAANSSAHRLFAHMGFRPTMVEMTRETPQAG